MLYRCDMCGCYLDPGEGRICEECREKSKRRKREKQELFGFIKNISKEQYEEWINESI